MLCCSAGHLYNPKNLQDVWWKGLREEGGSCPEVIDYDRMRTPPTTKCKRKLFDLDKKVETLYNKMFETYIPPSRYADFLEISFTGGGNSEKYKNKIRELIQMGKNVKVGYRCSTMIPDVHEQIIFYK